MNTDTAYIHVIKNKEQLAIIPKKNQSNKESDIFKTTQSETSFTAAISRFHQRNLSITNVSKLQDKLTVIATVIVTTHTQINTGEVIHKTHQWNICTATKVSIMLRPFSWSIKQIHRKIIKTSSNLWTTASRKFRSYSFEHITCYQISGETNCHNLCHSNL